MKLTTFLLAAAALVWPGSAVAHSGSISDLRRLSETDWAVTFSTTREGECSSSASCGGWSSAYQMPVGRPCPATDPSGDDDTRSVWSTDLVYPHTGDQARVEFEPDGETDTQLCLYLYAGGYHLVAATSFNHAAATPPPPAEVGEPEFDVTARTRRSTGRQRFDIESDGCLGLDRDADEELWVYTNDLSCTKRTLELRRNGRRYRTLAVRRSWVLKWDCARSGSYSWRVVYTHRGVPGQAPGTTYAATERGRFRIPACRPPKPRVVGRGYASAKAYDINEGAYPTEFISSVQCRPVNGASRASTWLCDTTHNNTYRQCVDTDRLTFTSRDRFGRPDRRVSTKTLRKRCSYF